VKVAGSTIERDKKDLKEMLKMNVQQELRKAKNQESLTYVNMIANKTTAMV